MTCILLNPWHHHQSMHITSPATISQQQKPRNKHTHLNALHYTKPLAPPPPHDDHLSWNNIIGTLPPSACMTHFFKSPVFSVDENILNVKSCHQNHLGVVTIMRKLVKMTLVLLLSLDLVCFIIFTWQTGSCYRIWSWEVSWISKDVSLREWSKAGVSFLKQIWSINARKNTWGKIMSPSVCLLSSEVATMNLMFITGTKFILLLLLCILQITVTRYDLPVLESKGCEKSSVKQSWTKNKHIQLPELCWPCLLQLVHHVCSEKQTHFWWP